MRRYIPLLGFLVVGGDLLAVERHQDPRSGLFTWSAEQGGFGLELIQLPPDNIRAMYGARGLPEDVIEEVASFCVFGSIARNLSDTPLSYRTADWRYRTPDGVEHRLKTKSEWLAEWRGRGLSFSWSILPDDLTFQAGDWAQGFTTVKLPRDVSFDLIYRWKLDGAEHVATIPEMRCPPEEVRLD